jgi:hypothetical protein
MATLKFNTPEIRVGLDSAKSTPIKKSAAKMPKDKMRFIKKSKNAKR